MSSPSSSSQESVVERLNRQMIGGNRFMDTNTWLESHARRPTQEEEEGGPVYNVWIPVPTGVDSVWKSTPLTELAGNKSTQVAEEGDVE
jgi:hypothetical protein